MRKNILLALVMILFTSAIAQAAENSAYDRVIAKGEFVCGVMPWAPYKVLDPNTGEWSGFGIEVYRRIFATLDIKVTFKEVVLGNQVQDLNTGRVDGICDDGPWTMSAAKFVDYSKPLYAAIVYPYVRADDKRFIKRSDFNQKDVTFTGIDGDLSSDLVKRVFPGAKLVTMESMTDVSQLFVNVQTKKADVVICDPAAFASYEKANPGKLKVASTEPLGRYRTVVSIKKGETELLGLINQAVDNGLDFGLIDDVLDTFDPERNKLLRIKDNYKLGK